MVAASYVIRRAQVGTLDAPAYLARLRYPAYYVDIAQDTGQGIDPLLLLSLMRYESLFNTYAAGSSGEKGLMQVSPTRADAIASELQWQNYQQADLFRPYAGITFGAYDLAEQLQRFGSNIPAALAAYSVGAGRAQAWLDLSGGDPDQFMTAIDDDSARAYVQSITSAYTIYRALYAG